jgi:hypothetical protein
LHALPCGAHGCPTFAMQKTNVKQTKSFMDFRDGVISGIGKYDLGVSEDAAMIEQVKFFLSAYVR